MTLYDHVQELRAELSRCCDAREIRQIEAELKAAQAELARQAAAFEAERTEDG
jgi:hypothetical protein